uniref:Uncharacterized protein n=1 Tax=Avena sativa TaxID=4498 RepID=A0ACD5VMF8_AVESA
MDKYRNRFPAPIVLSVLLLLTCFATHAQCRIMEDVQSVKINLPAGLCIRGHSCKGLSSCYYCCSIDKQCYPTAEYCNLKCGRGSPVHRGLLFDPII